MNICFSTGYGEHYFENAFPPDFGHKSESGPLQTNSEEIAMVGLDAMQRANSTLEDFVSWPFHYRETSFCVNFCVLASQNSENTARVFIYWALDILHSYCII